jgi:hypothetical protein
MRIAFSLTILSALLIFSGCATTPIPAASAKETPPARVLAFQNKPNGPFGTLVITRDVGYLGGGCYNSVTLNGTLAARMDVGEKSTFTVPPGEILMRVGRDPEGKALCGTSQDEWTQRETSIKADETKYFRLSIDANGKADIQRSE